jgi:CrcB protein
LPLLGVWIAIGGAFGAWARYALGGLIQTHAGASFPWATLVINVSGSLLLGFLIRLLEGVAVSADVRAMLTIGVLGAFTTFSTFSYETIRLAQDGQWLRAGAYSFGSLALGLVAVVGGLRLASIFLATRG